jgi:prepilin-type N-terminal cleavage/methylation domain-containing protein
MVDSPLQFPATRLLLHGATAGGGGSRGLGQRGFTLAEVLAALLLMAILIPVTMHGVTVASRAGMLGQRKTAAIRIAERVLEEQIVSGQMATATPNGTIVEGNVSYPWTMRSDPWAEDNNVTMNVVTVRVEFSVQGNTYDVAASTLYDPTIVATTVTSTPVTTTTP